MIYNNKINLIQTKIKETKETKTNTKYVFQ